MLTVADAQRRIAAGDLTAVELTETMLDRIARVDADLNAYLHVDAESALEQARAADRRRDRPPLLGVPVCVKDVIDVAGMPTTAGAAGWHRSPERDAVVVARLRAAGAVIVGKGNTNEFAYGADGLNPHRGDCRNPHDRSRITGGSSSGPAAATAAGTALAAVGTDTSGSIRVPASLCGLVGVRPTMGRVPRAGVLPLAPSYDAVGPLARTVEDAAILLGVLAGADVADSLDTGVRGLRLGVVETLVDAAEPYVAGGIASAAAHLESLGAELVPLRLERLRDAAAIHQVVQPFEAAQVHRPWFDSQRDRYAEPVRRRLEAGRRIPAPEYRAALEARRRLADDVLRAMDGVDAMLAPSTPTAAPPADAATVTVRGTTLSLREALLLSTLPTTQLPGPAVSVPVGTHSGLPYGMQIVGRPFDESLVLRVAAACSDRRRSSGLGAIAPA